MEKEKLKRYVYSLFSDTVMFLCALIILPITIIEIVDPTWTYASQLMIVDWIVWVIFLLEFALKVYVDESFIDYVSRNKLSSALSMIIIGSGLLAIFIPVVPATAIGVLRVLRVFRVVAYGDKAIH